MTPFTRNTMHRLKIITTVSLLTALFSFVLYIYVVPDNIKYRFGLMDDYVADGDGKFLAYDGKTVTGKTVTETIMRFTEDGSEICIEVSTLQGTACYIYTDETLTVRAASSTPTLASVSMSGKGFYVYSDALFMGTVTRDAYGKVVKIRFEQKSYGNG